MVVDVRWLVPLFLAVSSILAIVANSLLLLVFFKRRGLRTISNRFVINLLITNLLSSIVLIPLLVINEHKATELDASNSTTELAVESIYVEESKLTVTRESKLIELKDFIEIDREAPFDYDESAFLCYFSQIVTSLVCISSIFGILLIGIDQYFAVIHPLRYHSYINKSKSLVLLISTWAFSVFVALLDLLVFDFSTFWRFCRTEASKDYSALESVYAYLYFIIIVLIPFLVICSIYFKIYFAARKSGERMRKSNSTSNTSYNHLIIRDNEDGLNVKARDLLPRIHSAPNMSNLNVTESKRIKRSISDRTATNNIIISLKSKLSNASVFRYREETRAARISVLVIFMVLICYFPYGTTIILNSFRKKPNYVFNLVSVVLLISSNIISPFLFAYRNRKIQRELIKLFVPKLSGSKDGRTKTEPNNVNEAAAPFLTRQGNCVVPKVVVTLNAAEHEKKNILKRVCSKTWNYRKGNFISVPDSCLEARASFSSASTQISFAEE